MRIHPHVRAELMSALQKHGICWYDLRIWEKNITFVADITTNEMKPIRHILLALVMLTGVAVYGQRHEIYNDRIASLQVVAGVDWLSPPVITLNGPEVINIGFDDLTHEYHRYTYKVEHCEADWSVSTELFDTEYLEGFFEGNVIEDTEESLNTNQLYTHYRFQIPNSHCRLKMGGNYRVTVIDENEDEEMFSACFMVVEPMMGVSLEVSTITDIDVNNRYQQVSMDVSYDSGINIIYPERQLNTVVMQNGRWDNARINVPPSYRMEHGFHWSHCRDFIFDGGNEYHKFEILDNDHPTLGIDFIRWDGEMYHAYPFEDVPRPNYLYDEDANGAFYIRNSDNYENDRLSDYDWVHFRKPSERYLGEMYVNGVWTNDRFTDQYRLEYNDSTQSYEGAVLLKQGYYSYQYLLLDEKGITHNVEIEGNYYQTENTYQALVYFRETGGRTDRLVGYQQVQFGR